MIRIDWNPVAHVGPVPINWYGLGWLVAVFVGAHLVRRWASRDGIRRAAVEDLVIWILIGTLAGARLYYVAQNDPLEYLTHPWRIVAIWEGGLAFFGGLFGGIAAAYFYTKRAGLSFARIADLFAPAIPTAAAIGRLPCGLDGMDYGTPTDLPWGVVYMNPNSYAPTDGVARHPDQFYELAGDLAIAAVLLKLLREASGRDTLPDLFGPVQRAAVLLVFRSRQRASDRLGIEKRAMDGGCDFDCGSSGASRPAETLPLGCVTVKKGAVP